MKRIIVCSVGFTLALAMCMSCTKSVPIYTVSDIVGKWKMVAEGSSPTTTNRRCVYTINPDNTVTASLAFRQSEKQMGLFEYKQKGSYTFQDNVLTMTFGGAPDEAKSEGGDERKIFEKKWRVTSVNKTTLMMKALSLSDTSDPPTPPEPFTFSKVEVDYSSAILGLWEGVSLEGESEYGDENHRWEYKADSSYVYYSKVDNVWAPSTDIYNEFFVDGDWMASMWIDGAEPGTKNLEWWDIEVCNDTDMVWTAIRSKYDGTLGTTKFTMKKVQDQ